MHPSELCTVLRYAQATHCLMQSHCQALLPTQPAQALWVEKGNFRSSGNNFLPWLMLCSDKKKIRWDDDSVHVYITDKSQTWGQALPSSTAHLTSARNRATSSMSLVGQGPWVVSCLAPHWGSVWPCAGGHQLDLCQAPLYWSSHARAHILASCNSYRWDCQWFLSNQKLITWHDLGQIWAPEQLTLL